MKVLLTIRAFTAPLDTIKIRLQIQESTFAERQSIASVLKSLLKNEGVAALWKGNVPAEIMYVMYGAIQFTTFSVLSDGFSKFENAIGTNFSSATHSLVVGAGTGTTSTIITYPFDLLRTRLAANSGEFLSMSSTARDILRKDGLIGIFVGIKPAILSVGSTTGLMFWSYQIARSFTLKHDNIPFIEGFCGFFAGATSKGLTFPLDTVRKRTQMHSVTKVGPPLSAIRLFAQILRNEGLFGVYRGFSISVLKTAPTSAISLFVYEWSIQNMRKWK